MLKTVINYIYQTFDLKTEEVQQIIIDLPTIAKKDMVSTWDRLIQEGQIKGEAIGEERGKVIGEAKGEVKGIQIGEAIGILETEIKKNLEITLGLLKEMPKWEHEKIAKIAKVEKTYVEKVEATFAEKSEEKIIAYLHELYKEVPKMNEEKWTVVEKWGLELWKEYHAAN